MRLVCDLGDAMVANEINKIVGRKTERSGESSYIMFGGPDNPFIQFFWGETTKSTFEVACFEIPVVALSKSGDAPYTVLWDWIDTVAGCVGLIVEATHKASQEPLAGPGEAPQEGTFRVVEEGASVRSIQFVEDGERCTCEDCLNEASPCDTGECDCYMGPIYSVFVGDIEFEETRSPDPAEAWELFLPILERNPGFADRGVWLGETEVVEGFNE